MNKASFIVPVYNSEKFLEKCIESILNQDCQDFDVYCIEDCGQDASWSILEDYERRYPEKIHCLRNPRNIGQGRSRMRGLEASEGEYILFVDSDDYLASDYLTTFLEAADKTLADLVIAGFTKDIEGSYVEHDIVKNEWTLVTYPVACCKMYRRSFIVENEIDFSSVRRGEDIYFSLAAFCSNPRVEYIDYYGYYYRLNVSSTTQLMNADSQHERAVSKMFHLLRDKFYDESLTVKQRQMVEYAYIANMVNALIVYDHGCKPRKMREKYEFFCDDLNQLFPMWRQNPYYHYWGLEGPNNKIKLGVCITMRLLKCHLAWPVYWLLSLV